MMDYMPDALDEDVGHYGRLDFVMDARHFVDNEEIVGLLAKHHDANEQEIRVMAQQVEEKGYSPPRRDKVLELAGAARFSNQPEPRRPGRLQRLRHAELPRRGL